MVLSYILPLLSTFVVLLLSYFLEAQDQNYFGSIYYIVFTLVWSLSIYLLKDKIKHFPKPLYMFVVSLALLGSSPLFENDHYRYIWEGKVWINGANPYLNHPSSKKLNHIKYDERQSVAFKKLTTIYPPVALSWFSISSPFEHKTATIVLQFLNIVLLIIFLFQLMRLKVDAYLFFIFLPFWAKEYVQAVHIDFLAIIFLVQFLIEIKASRIHRSFIFWLLSFWTKYLAIFLLPVFIYNNWKEKKILSYYAIVFITSVTLFFLLSGYNPFKYSGAKLFIQHWYWNPGFFGFINRYFNIHTDIARPLTIGLFFSSSLFYLYLYLKNKIEQNKYSLLVFASLMFFAPVYNAFYTVWFLVFAILERNSIALIYGVFSCLCYTFYSFPQYTFLAEIFTHIWFVPFAYFEIKKALV